MDHISNHIKSSNNIVYLNTDGKLGKFKNLQIKNDKQLGNGQKWQETFSVSPQVFLPTSKYQSDWMYAFLRLKLTYDSHKCCNPEPSGVKDCPANFVICEAFMSLKSKSFTSNPCPAKIAWHSE